MRTLLPLLALPLLTTACDPPTPASTSSQAPPPPATTQAPPASAPVSAEAPAPAPTQAPTAAGPSLPPPTAAELDSFAKGNNAFAFDLYGKARAAKGNLAISPVSLVTALTMTWAGARGDTAAQMKKVLHADGSSEAAIEVAGKLAASFKDPSRKVTLRLANRLFGEKTYTFERAYTDRVRASFGAPFEALDFKKDAEGGRKRINDWVAGETQSRIKDLIPAGVLDGDTRLVLTNAIYFLGDWADPFDKDATRPEAFHTSATESKTVPTMHKVEAFRFAAKDGVKVLEMPYQGGDLAMTFVLPDAVNGLEAVEKKLSPAMLDGLVAALASQRVLVSLPKFEIDPKESLSVGDMLKDLGMPLAFERLRADFTGIANPPKPEDRLYISKVFHKAFVKLDEKGTEAAAASAVAMARAGGAPSAPPEFKADHPFLFFLRDTRSKMILFMGRVTDPSSK